MNVGVKLGRRRRFDSMKAFENEVILHFTLRWMLMMTFFTFHLAFFILFFHIKNNWRDFKHSTSTSSLILKFRLIKKSVWKTKRRELWVNVERINRNWQFDWIIHFRFVCCECLMTIWLVLTEWRGGPWLFWGSELNRPENCCEPNYAESRLYRDHYDSSFKPKATVTDPSTPLIPLVRVLMRLSSFSAPLTAQEEHYSLNYWHLFQQSSKR